MPFRLGPKMGKIRRGEWGSTCQVQRVLWFHRVEEKKTRDTASQTDDACLSYRAVIDRVNLCMTCRYQNILSAAPIPGNEPCRKCPKKGETPQNATLATAERNKKEGGGSFSFLMPYCYGLGNPAQHARIEKCGRKKHHNPPDAVCFFRPLKSLYLVQYPCSQ